jgi:hypothetical protein
VNERLSRSFSRNKAQEDTEGYRQETIAEKGWDGEFETSGRDWGRSRRTGVRFFSMLKVGGALLSKIKILLAHAKMGHSR